MVSIQIRDLPEQVRDTIAEAARSRGQSMQAYLYDLVVEDAQRANNIALLNQLRARGGGHVGVPGEAADELDAIRADRDRQDADR